MLEVNNLCFSYGKNRVLENIKFLLNNNDKLNIIGSNGCGKTTLLKCLCGILEYSGEVFIDNVSIKNMSRRDVSKKISLLTQFNESYFDYKVIDVVKLGRYAHEKRGIFNITRDDNEKVLESLEKLKIIDLKDKYLSELSGGQIQKVFIGRMVAQNPDIVLLDEPNNNLDLKSQINLIEIINEVFCEKIVISVFHDLNIVSTLDFNILMLKDGKIHDYGNMEEVFSKENLYEIYGIDVQRFMENSFLKWSKRK